MARRKSLSKELRSARERRGLSVADVASRVGVSQASIYFWEGGHGRPRIENLKALCKVLKLPVRDALEATGV
jgi:transcriptional regulator with XRE-family HTH domain